MRKSNPLIAKNAPSTNIVISTILDGQCSFILYSGFLSLCCCAFQCMRTTSMPVSPPDSAPVISNVVANDSMPRSMSRTGMVQVSIHAVCFLSL